VLDDEEVLVLDTRVRLVQWLAFGLAGTTVDRAEVRSDTGCAIVAVVRDGETSTDISPDPQITKRDKLVLVGTDDGVERFTEQFV
jgi:K+/H+ antiporter YhaU regulatory subunit KhtT